MRHAGPAQHLLDEPEGASRQDQRRYTCADPAGLVCPRAGESSDQQTLSPTARGRSATLWLGEGPRRSSGGVAGGFGGVLPSRGDRPGEGTVGVLIHFPLRILLEPVLMPALRRAITQTRSTLGFIRGVVFEVALLRGATAGRAGAGGVPDLGQVPELDPRVVAGSLEPVIAGIGGDRVDADDQVRLPGDPGAQPPPAVPAGRPVLAFGGEGEPRAALPGRIVGVRAGLAGRIGPAGRARARPRSVRRSGGWPGSAGGLLFLPFRGGCGVVAGLGSGAAVADGVAVLVGDGQAPGGLGVRGRRAGQVAGEPGVDRADAGDLAGPLSQLQQGGQRDGEVVTADEPRRDHTGPGRRPRPGRIRPPGPAVSRAAGTRPAISRTAVSRTAVSRPAVTRAVW